MLETARLPASNAEEPPTATNVWPFDASIIEMGGDDRAFLRASEWPARPTGGSVRIVDLFCGAGGLTLGAIEAARSLGKRVDIRYAVDFERAAIDCYASNFPHANSACVDLRTVFLEDLEAPISKTERMLCDSIGPVDILLGGPPCQGHSDLNNYSRRSDPKNHLYKVMGRAARILNPTCVVIENVPGAMHDQAGSVATTVSQLRSLGFWIDVATVNAIDLGVAQRRKRLIVVATKDKKLRLSEVVDKYKIGERNIAWAMGDIQDEAALDIRSIPALSTPTTRKRIDYLFDNFLHDLPDSERPPCHRNNLHSYRSVYGRMSWDRPSQTVTSGFYSMCMGRYVHPSKRRTITAHEAARLQFFPDYFDFRPAGSRTSLAKIIGNAVPPKLIYPFIREVLL